MPNKDIHQNNHDKEVAYYSAIVQGWINTRMERDKSLLTLSAAALGLLVTLLTSVGVKSILLAAFYALAIICFTCALITAIKIFRRNADYLEKIAQEKDKENLKTEEVCLRKLDKLLYLSFIIGVVFALVIGVISAINNFIN